MSVEILKQAKEAVARMSVEQKKAIYMVLKGEVGSDGGGGENAYGTGFSFETEINEQMKAIRAMRNEVMSGGRISSDVSIRDVKETLSASTTLLQTLIKSHGEIVNFERLRAVEGALVTAAKEAGIEGRVLELVEESVSKLI